MDLVWLAPVMVAISTVLATAGADGLGDGVRRFVHSLVTLTLGVLAVGVVLHLVARIFA
jgi:hypothetical protein